MFRDVLGVRGEWRALADRFPNFHTNSGWRRDCAFPLRKSIKIVPTRASSKDVSNKVTNEQYHISNVRPEYITEKRRTLEVTDMRRLSVTAILGVVIAKPFPDEKEASRACA